MLLGIFRLFIFLNLLHTVPRGTALHRVWWEALGTVWEHEHLAERLFESPSPALQLVGRCSGEVRRWLSLCDLSVMSAVRGALLGSRTVQNRWANGGSRRVKGVSSCGSAARFSCGLLFDGKLGERFFSRDVTSNFSRLKSINGL